MDRSKNITAVFFTCNRDKMMVRVAAERLMEQGVTVTLCIEKTDKFDPYYLPEGARVTYSSWPRNSNLNGKKAVIGVMEELRDAGDHFQSEWVVKIDSDTLVSDSWLKQFGTSDLYGFSSSGRVFYGAAYAIRTALIRPFIKRANELLDDNEAHPEDITVGELMTGFGRKQCRTLGWWNNKNNTTLVKSKYSMTFGWVKNMPGPFNTDSARREVAANRMLRFNFQK